MKEIENKLIAGGEALKLRPAAVAVIFAALTLLKLLCGADSISRKNPTGDVYKRQVLSRRANVKQYGRDGADKCLGNRHLAH